MFASLDASDYSSEAGHAEASLAIAVSGAVEAEAEADSCGYEGDVGEGAKKLTASARRAAVIAPPGFSASRVCVWRLWYCCRSAWCEYPMRMFWL